MSKAFDFKNGDIVEYAGELFIVIDNYGSSGHVREYFGDDKTGDDLRLYWHYDGEDCKLIGRL